MRRFITSDIHFFHNGILRFCPDSRPYKDVTEMNEDIIQKWNTKVNWNDEVWILGDVSFGKPEETVRFMNRLNGTKHLVVGNHDRKLLNHAPFRLSFSSVQDYAIISHEGTKCVLGHFPFLEWEGCHKGYISFYGHVHGTRMEAIEKYRCMDVGMDTNNCTVYDLDTVVRLMLKKEILTHHGKVKE